MVLFMRKMAILAYHNVISLTVTLSTYTK